MNERPVCSRVVQDGATTECGVSLLELVVAVSLVAIVALIGVLGHQAVRARLGLGIASRQVVMDLKLARMRAVAKNRDHRILFPTGGARYQRQYRDGRGYRDDGAAVALPQGVTVVDCTANGHAISFRPRGSAGSFGTVTIRNAEGGVRRIIVDIAGQVRVE